MSDQQPPYQQPPYQQQPYQQAQPHQQQPYQQQYQQLQPYQQQPYAQPGQAGLVRYGAGAIGQPRDTGLNILLYLVTCGLWGLYWFYVVHDEMQRHTGRGLGGVMALVIGFFLAPVMFFLTPMEIGQMYQSRGWRSPVSGLNGLWILLPFAGPIVWFVQVNGALNAYWRALGAK